MSGRSGVGGRRFRGQWPSNEAGRALGGRHLDVARLAAEHFEICLVVATGEVRACTVERDDVIDLWFEGDAAAAGTKPAGEDASAVTPPGADFGRATCPDPLVIAVIQVPAAGGAVEALAAGEGFGANAAGTVTGRTAQLMIVLAPSGHRGPSTGAVEGRVRVPGTGEMEAPVGFEPAVELLQSSALPLGHGALKTGYRNGAQGEI